MPSNDETIILLGDGIETFNLMAKKLLPNLSSKFLWQLIIIGISLLAILLFFIFRIIPISNPNLPLLIAIIIGGVPSIVQIILKLIKGDLGADSLAAIALITAVILNQYLAAVIIILMISSGQALEAYAMRKASSVLLALAERMPTIAASKNLRWYRRYSIN